MECNFTPKKMMQNAIDKGTNNCSQIEGHPKVYPRPETPSNDIPEQTVPTMRRTNTQNPRDLPATR